MPTDASAPRAPRASRRHPTGPIRAVHGVTLGEVRVRPNNVSGSGTPMLWWTLTARSWTPWLPVLAFVVEHERGTLLFDTGQSPQSLTDPDFYPGGMLGWVYRRQAQFRVSDDHELTANLAALGLAPADVSHVALSHLHQDHAGNLAPVAHATVLASPAELALLGERRPELHGVLASRILPPEVTLTPASFTPSGQAGAPDDPALSAFDECADVFGDGSAVLLPTPGHSPGSMSLLLRPADARPLLLVGDVTYDPALMARGVLTDVGDRAAQRDTADRIARLAEALPGLVVLAAHDRAALAALQAS